MAAILDSGVHMCSSPNQVYSFRKCPLIPEYRSSTSQDACYTDYNQKTTSTLIYNYVFVNLSPLHFRVSAPASRMRTLPLAACTPFPLLKLLNIHVAFDFLS